MSGHRTQRQGDVFGTASEDSGLVEARCECHHSESGDAAVGRLEPGQPGQGGRLANRAAGFGAGGDRGKSCRDGCGGASGRPPRHALRIPRDCRRRRTSSSGWTNPSRTSSMFVLPSITVPLLRNRSTTVASYGAMNPSSIRDPQDVRTPRVQNMSLCARGMPSSGPSSPARLRSSAPSRLGQGDIAGDGDEGVQSVVVRRDAIEEVHRELDARELPSPEGVAEGGKRKACAWLRAAGAGIRIGVRGGSPRAAASLLERPGSS